MRRELSPAYLWYVRDYRSDPKLRDWSFAERGMYREMLDEQWLSGSLPDSAPELALLLGGTEAEWQAAWLKLTKCFVPRKRDGRLVNLKLERVRLARRKFQKGQSQNGLAGARAKWQKYGKPIGSPSESPGEGMAKDGLRSSSASVSPVISFPSSPPSAVAGEPAAPPAALGSSRKPIFEGQRLVVFPFQLDQLKRMLGVHALAFDLGGWFVTLDARMVESPVVIPLRDGGMWLQQQTLIEAARRDLPIAVPASTDSAAGKQTTRLAAAREKIAREAQR
jgi:hypothetical protein